MENLYTNENRLIKGMEKFYPDIAKRLNYPGNPEGVKKIEEKIGEKLPEEFVQVF